MAEHAADFTTDCSRCPVRARHVDGPESEANFAKLAAVLRPCRFRKGQTLLVEGHLSERVIFVRSGTIRLTRVMPSGEDMLLDFVGPGGVVGLESRYPRAP